jgi:hypothetical protein
VETADELEALFTQAERALADGRPHDAVAGFEALADRGALDGAASFDRGLAYAQRVRAGVDVPGDLGQAAHGFEEASGLTADPGLQADAARAAAMIRSEVARRRARAGEPVELERGEPLGRTIVAAAAEDTWALVAFAATLLLGAALFVRALSPARAARLAAGVALALSLPVLVAGTTLTLAARDIRLHEHDAVVVGPAVRIVDERGVVLPSGMVVPEAARVHVLETKGSLARVRWGGTAGWVQAGTIRMLATPQ